MKKCHNREERYLELSSRELRLLLKFNPTLEKNRKIYLPRLELLTISLNHFNPKQPHLRQYNT